jgi:hypothetical protein
MMARCIVSGKELDARSMAWVGVKQWQKPNGPNWGRAEAALGTATAGATVTLNQFGAWRVFQPTGITCARDEARPVLEAWESPAAQAADQVVRIRTSCPSHNRRQCG